MKSGKKMSRVFERQSALVRWMAKTGHSQTMFVFRAAVDNRRYRHCRIGRITLKEQA